MEIKQQLKLSQQLVMTPQLQQAIKLLQLSRMELCDLVRDEMLENPILEDEVESANEQAKAARRPRRRRATAPTVERVGETETPIVEIRDDKVDTTAEVKGDASSTGGQRDRLGELPRQLHDGRRADARVRGEQRGAAVARGDADQGTSLHDHLEWQLKLSHFPLRRRRASAC